MTPRDGLRDDIVQGASPRDVADFAVHHEAHRGLEVSYGLNVFCPKSPSGGWRCRAAVLRIPRDRGGWWVRPATEWPRCGRKRRGGHRPRTSWRATGGFGV